MSVMNIFQRYAQLKKQQEDVVSELGVLGKEIKRKVQDSKKDNKHTEWGLFSLIHNRKYEYSKGLIKTETKYKDLIKELKIAEQKMGIKSKPNICIRFTKPNGYKSEN